MLCDSCSFFQFIYIRKQVQKVAKFLLSLFLALGPDFKHRFSVDLWLLIDEFQPKIVVIVVALLVACQNSREFCIILRTFGKWGEEVALGRRYEIKVIIFS